MNVRQAKKVWRARLTGRTVSRGRLDPAEHVMNKAFRRAPRREQWLATMPGWDGSRWGRWDPTPVERLASGERRVVLVEACCVRCKARGYHHGFGEGGHDPDWCIDCGGAGTFMVKVG